jgi:hypothetical protein
VKKTTRLILRISPDDKDEIRLRANTYGYSITDFLLEGGLRGKVQPVLSINLQQWHRLAGLVSNLNQLVRHCNEGTVSPDLQPTLDGIQREVLAIRHDLITKQGERA